MAVPYVPQPEYTAGQPISGIPCDALAVRVRQRAGRQSRVFVRRPSGVSVYTLRWEPVGGWYVLAPFGCNLHVPLEHTDA